eukprot:Nk52_evm10s2340 gene=Nk52_evmTU10s2340
MAEMSESNSKHLFSRTLEFEPTSQLPDPYSPNENHPNSLLNNEQTTQSNFKGARPFELRIQQLSKGDEACVVWDSALVLVYYFQHQGRRFNPSSVCELGAGTGILGLYTAARGAKVVLTDLDKVQFLLEINAKENEKCIADGGGSVHCVEYKWGESISSSKLNSFLPFDVILVSDCIYYEASVDPLVSSIRSLINSSLTVKSTEKCQDASSLPAEVHVYISFELRPDKMKFTKQFLHALLQYPTEASLSDLRSGVVTAEDSLHTPPDDFTLKLKSEFISQEDMHPVYASPDIVILHVTATFP